MTSTVTAILLCYPATLFGVSQTRAWRKRPGSICRLRQTAWQCFFFSEMKGQRTRSFIRDGQTGGDGEALNTFGRFADITASSSVHEPRRQVSVHCTCAWQQCQTGSSKPADCRPWTIVHRWSILCWFWCGREISRTAGSATFMLRS